MHAPEGQRAPLMVFECFAMTRCSLCKQVSLIGSLNEADLRFNLAENVGIEEKMKSFSADELEQIANLAMLNLTKIEAESLGRDLSNILRAFEELDGSGFESFAGGDSNLHDEVVVDQNREQVEPSILRPDVPIESEQNTSLLVNVFPEARHGFLVVPPVIERE